MAIRAGGSWISSSTTTRSINAVANKPFFYFTPKATKGNDDFSLTRKRSEKKLVTISTSDIGRWLGEWNSDYILSLQDLQLEDLAEDDDPHHDHNKVSIHLSIHKHAGFGLSVDGRIVSSFTRKCCNCSSPYCAQIDTSFTVWILPSRKQKGSLPILGWEDPSVIYVKPGCEAELDSLIQDTIRLATSIKETCSEPCEKAEPRLQLLGKQNAASIDRRWSKLLELKKGISIKSQ